MYLRRRGQLTFLSLVSGKLPRYCHIITARPVFPLIFLSKPNEQKKEQKQKQDQEQEQEQDPDLEQEQEQEQEQEKEQKQEQEHFLI